MAEMVSKEQAVKDVRIMAKRMALLYRCFCETLEKEMGEEKTLELVRKVVDDYGHRAGLESKAYSEKESLPLLATNYSKAPDLPSMGWEIKALPTEEEQVRVQVDYCPLAATWKEMGQSVYDRIYCWVDQAKYSGYNPELNCTHVRNKLDGDEACEILVKKK